MEKRILFLLLLSTGSVLAAFGTGQTDKKNKVDLTIEYDNKGSRSESRHHYLALNGKSVPDVFEMIEIDGTLYRFATRDNNWGDDGYVPVPDSEMPYSGDSGSITSENKSRGWYLSEKRKKDTPRNWCWVSRDGKTAFVSPERINEFSETMGFTDIPRREMLEMFKD
jgi:hypothetical protein